MLIKCRILMDGPGPSEQLIEVNTQDGTDEVSIYKGSMRDRHLEVGKPLANREGYVLVELPRESASGKWRVWVPASDVLQTA